MTEKKDRKTAASAPTASSASRRTFLKGAGMATGIVAAGRPMVHAASGSTIRVGLVGCGGRGTGAAVNAMSADPAVRIVGLADLFNASMQNCRKSLGERYLEPLLLDCPNREFSVGTTEQH